MEAVHRTKAGTIQENIQQWTQSLPDLHLTGLIFAIPVLRLGKIVEDHWDLQCVKHFGLRSNDMRVLLALRRVGPPHAKRPTDLFQSLLITSGAITKQVDRLARRKLVKRLPDPNHGGGCLIHLTPQGVKVSNKAVEIIAGEGPLHDALMQISLRERQAGLKFLVKLLTLMGQ
jgi:DNA-binding MarR family transcriptional regulator